MDFSVAFRLKMSVFVMPYHDSQKKKEILVLNPVNIQNAYSSEHIMRETIIKLLMLKWLPTKWF